MVVVITVISQQEGFGFESHLHEACMGLHFLPQSKNMHGFKLSGNSNKVTINVSASACLFLLASKYKVLHVTNKIK